MWKLKLIVTLLLSIHIILGQEFVSAQEPLEELPLKMGYKSIEDAVVECEEHFGRDIKLPLKLPPIVFTHQFGRCSNSVGEINDELEIEFISELDSANHYLISIRPDRNNKKFSPKRNVVKIYKLKNNSNAFYGTLGSAFDFLSFEKAGWHYFLSVDHRAAEKVSPEKLVEIADSVIITYPDPSKENPLLR